MMSDDSENDGIYVDRLHENNVYYKKYKLLLEECETIQKSNERLVYRIEEVKKITKRRLDQVEYIKQRLKTRYGEDWTEIPHAVHEPMDVDSPSPPARAREPKAPPATATGGGGKSRKPAAAGGTAPLPPPPQPGDEKPGKGKRPPKRRPTKAERDPRAPKRPSNPFFQFCQEQRQPLMEELVAELQPGQVEPNKQELTRQLAIRWKTLGPTQKQVYVDMYEKSKEKYAAEMSEYNMKK